MKNYCTTILSHISPHTYALYGHYCLHLLWQNFAHWNLSMAPNRFLTPPLSLYSKPPHFRLRTGQNDNEMSLFPFSNKQQVCNCHFLSGDALCPTRAKNFQIDFQNHSCSQSSFCRSRWSGFVSFGILSIPLGLWFGYRKHQRNLHRQGQLYKFH